MAANGERGMSAAASKEAAADHQELRTLFSPTQTLRVLDDFANWVFGTTAVVGALGAGLGLVKLDALDRDARKIFLAAVLCISVALILATLARAPRAVRVNRDQPDALRRAYEEVVTRRYRLLLAASALVAVAIGLAGLATLVSD